MVAPVIAAIGAAASAAGTEVTAQAISSLAGAISGGGEPASPGTSGISVDASSNAGSEPVSALLGSHINGTKPGSGKIFRIKRVS